MNMSYDFYKARQPLTVYLIHVKYGIDIRKAALKIRHIFDDLNNLAEYLHSKIRVFNIIVFKTRKYRRAVLHSDYLRDKFKDLITHSREHRLAYRICWRDMNKLFKNAYPTLLGITIPDEASA